MRSLRTSFLFALTAAVFLAAHAACAQDKAERVEADVATRSVAITSSFTGAEILVFGTVVNSRQPGAASLYYDVIVVVDGLAQPAAVRKKSRVAGLWINTSSVRFSSFPSYYAIAASRPLDEIADPALLKEHSIGFQYVRMVPSGSIRSAPSTAEEAEEYRMAAVRLKQGDGLFVLRDEGGVVFVGNSLFRSTIPLPPNVPVGSLTAHIYLFHDGKLLSEFKRDVDMERAGIERFIYEAAYKSPLLYGMATVLIAAAAGLVAAYVFRRVGG